MLDITIGAPQTHRNLTVFPLMAAGAPELPYALLGDALEAGTVRIGEVGQGTVPTLAAKNVGDTDVLVLDGEQLIGARQNRMTNRSILLAARSTTEIPVSCMEHGRWHFESPAMQPAPQHSPAKVRRRARELEALHVRAGEVAAPSMLREAQGAVWEAIADTEAKLGMYSPTGAMDALYVGSGPQLEEMTRAFPASEGQVGLLAFVEGVPLGMDLVGGRGLYARLHARLLRGYVLDALDRASERTSGQDRAEENARAAGPQAFLDAVRAAARVPSPTVGKGTYAVLAGSIIGGELLDGAAVAHLSAFPAQERPEGLRGSLHEAPLPPPSVRRRHPRLD